MHGNNWRSDMYVYCILFSFHEFYRTNCWIRLQWNSWQTLFSLCLTQRSCEFRMYFQNDVYLVRKPKATTVQHKSCVQKCSFASFQSLENRTALIRIHFQCQHQAHNIFRKRFVSKIPIYTKNFLIYYMICNTGHVKPMPWIECEMNVPYAYIYILHMQCIISNAVI